MRMMKERALTVFWNDAIKVMKFYDKIHGNELV